MGIARRSSAAPGTSQSIFDDLRIVRSRGGLKFAHADDLTGTSALARYQFLDQSSAVEHARNDITAHVTHFLTSIIDGASEDLGQRLAAGSLQILLIGDRKPRDFSKVRSDIGVADHRDSEYVRTQEDALLEVVAREFWNLHAEDAPAHWPAGFVDEDHAIGERHCDFGDVLGAMRTTLLEITLIVGSEGDATVEHRTTELVVDYVHLLGEFERSIEPMTDIYNGMWEYNVRAIAGFLFPLTVDEIDSVDALRRKHNEAQAGVPLTSNYESPGAIAAVAKGFIQAAREFRAGKRPEERVQLLRMHGTCDDIDALTAAAYYGDDLDTAIRRSTDGVRDICYLLDRETEASERLEVVTRAKANRDTMTAT